MKNFMHKNRCWLVALAAVLLAFVVGGLVWFSGRELPEDYTPELAHENGIEQYNGVETDDFTITLADSALGQIEIKALSSSVLGISRDSQFLVSHVAGDVTLESLSSSLNLSKDIGFDIESYGEGFILTMHEELPPNAIVNFVYSPPGYQPARFAFQTEDIFRVMASTPADQSWNVPNDTGIEITFTRPLGVDFSEVFSITPFAAGSFLQRDNTYIFVPDAALEAGIFHTVSISRETISECGEMLGEYFVFRFTTAWGNMLPPSQAYMFSIAGDAYETFLPWHEVLIALDAPSNLAGERFRVAIYDLETPERFLNFNPLTDSFGEPFMELAPTLTRIEVSEWTAANYLFLEETLPVGHYVARVQLYESSIARSVYKFIQVSPISVYSFSMPGKVVFWLNCAYTGDAAVGAAITALGQTVFTDADGVARLETPRVPNAPVFVKYGGSVFAYSKPLFAHNLLLNGRFLTFMYTDRPQYRPNDLVDVFGVILPRHGHEVTREDVFTIRFADILELPIVLDEYHSFMKRVPVENMYGHMEITVEVNGERLMSTWVYFSDYTNLNYVITGSFDRLAYFAGDTAVLNVNATTFARRPVEGLRMQSWDLREQARDFFITDPRGEAVMEIVARERTWQTGWEPFWQSVWFSTLSGVDVVQSVGFHKIVFPRDIMMEHEYMGGSTAVLTTSAVTLARMEEFGTDTWGFMNPDLFRGQPVDVDFTVEITRHVTTRTVRSRHYDHINRRAVTVYDFHTTSQRYRTFSGRTVNGRAELAGLPYSTDQMVRFTITVSYTDSRGNAVTITLINQEWVHFHTESSIRQFGFVLDNTTLRVGETTRARMVENPDPQRHLIGTPWISPDWEWEHQIELTQGRMILIFARGDGILSVSVGEPSGIQLEFPEEAISSAVVFGAYFDGQFIFPTEWPQPVVIYDFTERELTVEILFDNTEYKPGGEVRATVYVTGPGGEPAPAQVAISVVDEASIMSRHEANFLSRLYSSSHGRFWDFAQFASFTQHEFGFGFGGAEGGGGEGLVGEPTFREFFEDNPVFEFVNVGDDGRGEITFNLPDQITSWRVTALALTRDGFAGDARVNIVSYLPFYVDLVLTNEFLVGDDIAALVRVHGAADEEADVLFEVLQGERLIISENLTARGDFVVNAGKLDAGVYTMRVYVRVGDSGDGVSLPFNVVESGLILPDRKLWEVAPGEAMYFDHLAMRTLPVRVSLSNANMQPLVDILHSAWDRSSLRTDFIASTAFAEGFFRNIWANGDEIVAQDTAAFVRGRIHGVSGGIPELLHGSEDFFFTARFAAAFPEFVNRRRLLEFVDLVNGNAPPWVPLPRELQLPMNPLRESAEILILASIGEPVLLRLHYLVEELSFGNSFDDGQTLLQLASAFVVLGDYSAAAGLLEGFDIGGVLFTSDVQRETLHAHLLFINTSINPSAAWEYIREKQPNTFVSDVPERINFVRTVYVLGDTVSVVSYYLHGETHMLELRNFESALLTVSREQFENLAMTPVSGTTNVLVNFYAYDGGNWDAWGNRVQIERTLTREGDLIRVDLTVTVPEPGFFVIYDRLPSNLRFVPFHVQERGWANWFMVRNIQRQHVELSFFADRVAGGLTRRFTYFAIELFEADMEDGVTYVSNGRAENHVWGRTR